MKHLKIKSFGPIASADVEFGDLTFLVGPQASGKSIFVQLLKLLIDKKHIRKTLQQYNYIWGKDINRILDLYFGEGMSGLWRDDTEIKFDGNIVTGKFLLPVSGRYGGTADAHEKLFYIPAQRILSVADGRPKTFMEFDAATPYVLREFSETLRQMLQNGMSRVESIFPINNRLKLALRESFNESIFHHGKVIMKETGSGQKKLRMEVNGSSIPFITWSAGQKEFLPLLLGFYWLCPPSKVSRKEDIEFVVIEEPEMGLHPQAIKSVILQVIDLLSRGYKVIISTHSPVLLEFAWAFNYLQKNNANDELLFELFAVPKTAGTKRLFEGIISDKTINTFYFERDHDHVVTKNISALDAGSDDEAISNWGGLTDFATKAGEAVSKFG